MKKIYQIQNLTIKYDKKTAIKNVSFDIYDNDFFVIIGANGSGKSTLVQSMVRVNQTPYYGFIKYKNCFVQSPNQLSFWLKKTKSKLINGKDKQLNEKWYYEFKNAKQVVRTWRSKELAKEVSYVPQISQFPEATTVYEFVKMGYFPHTNTLGFSNKKSLLEKQIKNALDAVEIWNYRNQEISNLSGGQQQRAVIALALLQNTNTIILDEPTNHLDIKSQLEIMQLLHNLHHNLNKTIIMVTHDLNLGIKYANRICIIKDGQIMAIGNTHDVINHETIHHAFGVHAELVMDDQNELKIHEIKLED